MNERGGDVEEGSSRLVFIHFRGWTSRGLEDQAWPTEGRAHGKNGRDTHIKPFINPQTNKCRGTVYDSNIQW